MMGVQSRKSFFVIFLVDFLLVQDAREKGITSVSLEATETDRPLYEKYGFSGVNEESFCILMYYRYSLLKSGDSGRNFRRENMFEIRKKSNEAAPVLQHSDRVFHDALVDGRRRYHVSRDDGEDYDIVYTKNFDYILPMMPEAYRYIEVYWDFLKYDENDMSSVV